VIDPIAIRLTLWIANYTKLFPSFFTVGSIILSCVSAYLFYIKLFIWGAIIYEIAFIFDCIDGKLAKLKGISSDVGIYLDTIGDKIRLLVNTFALAFYGGWNWALIFLGLYLWAETEASVFSEIIIKKKLISNKKEEEKIKILRFRNKLTKKRLTATPFSLVEQDTLAFFVGPLIHSPTWGFKLAIIVNLIKRATSILHFWRIRYRGLDIEKIRK
jgi:phosphatidylglycerophosphate synthase